MKKNNVEMKIEKLEKQIGDLISSRKEKIAKKLKNTSRIWNIFKRESKSEKEIEYLTNKIDELSKKLSLLKAKISNPTVNLRANIKNELKAYIIQKILNEPESKIIFKEINTIIDEIMIDIDFDKISFDNSKIKTTIKDEMLEKLKENFEFIEDKNTNTLEAFKSPKGEGTLT